MPAELHAATAEREEQALTKKLPGAASALEDVHHLVPCPTRPE